MTKDHILAEIHRTAGQNGGVPLGRERFLSATGIKESDWHGRYWARWSDAIREAGFEPNQLNAALPDDHLLSSLAALVQELGHFPVAGEIKLKARIDPGFPSHNTFRRFGSKGALAAKLVEFSSSRGLDDVATICAPLAVSSAEPASEGEAASSLEFGFVYLMKSGRFYKVGRTNALGRRERELAIQLPERVKIVHTIKTDDPAGIEVYWHRRFEHRHKNGEWFELTAADVAAFRRRKFM